LSKIKKKEKPKHYRIPRTNLGFIKDDQASSFCASSKADRGVGRRCPVSSLGAYGEV